MAILGLKSTKDFIYVARTEVNGGSFSIGYNNRLSFCCTDLSGLYQAFEMLLASQRPLIRVAILRCSSGDRGSSVEAIKGEAICELVAERCGLCVSSISPQSLPRALTCPKGVKWQEQAKALFNTSTKLKYFTSGLDGAVAAAYKASQDS